MSDELVSQLISGGVGITIAAAVFGIVWKAPELMRAIRDVLAVMMETANVAAVRIEQTNERLTLSNNTLLASLQESQNLNKDSIERLGELDKTKTNLTDRVVSLEEVRDLLNTRVTFLETALKVAYEASNTAATPGLVEDLAENKDDLVEVEKKLDESE